MPASCTCLTASMSTKRTSTRPSARDVMLPTTTASAPRARKSPRRTSSARAGRGTIPDGSISRNNPLRERSAPTMPVMPSGQFDSFSKPTMAMGTVLPAPPTISIVSCARAASGAKAKSTSGINKRKNRGTNQTLKGDGWRSFRPAFMQTGVRGCAWAAGTTGGGGRRTACRSTRPDVGNAAGSIISNDES